MSSKYLRKASCGFFLLFALQPDIGIANTRSTEISFIENKGQWDDTIRFKAEIPDGTLFLTNGGWVYNFWSPSDLEHFGTETRNRRLSSNDQPFYMRNYHAYRIDFKKTRSKPDFETGEERDYYHNYFVGNDSSKWASKVGLYGKIRQKGIYPGIDVEIYSNANHKLKYDFIVAPGADPDQIKLHFDGVRPELSEDGDVIIVTNVNTVVEKRPYTYQLINGQQVEIPCRYRLTEQTLSFEFPKGFDSNYPLIIDPELVFATFSGGVNGFFYAHSTTFDSLGNTYTAALADGPGWPTTLGAYQQNLLQINTSSACINKYTPDGSSLIYSTYFSGAPGPPFVNMVSITAQPNTLRVNHNNELIMAGCTTSPTIPTTSGAFQSTLSGNSDLYIARFSEDGTSLLSSTYLGGMGNEGLLVGDTSPYEGLGTSLNAINPTDIAVDLEGNIWITSNSESADFPVTQNAYQQQYQGNYDAILVKMPPNLSTILYGSYIGGADWDGGIGLEYNHRTDQIGLVGMTRSADLPISTSAFKSAMVGKEDGFALLMNNTSYLSAGSTYLGTPENDNAMRLGFDCDNNVYVTGRTMGDYPITATGGYVNNGGIYVDKLNSTLTASLASTRTGSKEADIIASALAIDVCGNILLSTVTSAKPQANMPLTPDAFMTNPQAFYFAAFDQHFEELLFGSYFGSSTRILSATDHYHPGVSRMDPQGIIYHSVCASGPIAVDWPTTSGVYAPDKLNGLNNDNVTFKFNFDVLPHTADIESPQGGNDPRPHMVRGCKPTIIKYKKKLLRPKPMIIRLELEGDAISGIDYAPLPDTLIIPANDSMVSMEVYPFLAPVARGPKQLIINAITACTGCDSNEERVRRDTIWILDSLYVDILTPIDTFCEATPFEIVAEIDTTLNYVWQPDHLIPDPRPLGLSIHPLINETTTFTITVTQPGAPSTCPPNSSTYLATVEHKPKIDVFPREAIICLPSDSFNLSVSVTPNKPDYTYLWEPSDYLRNDSSLDNKFHAPIGDYIRRIKVITPAGGCKVEDSIILQVVPGFRILSVTPKDTIIRYRDSIQLRAEGDAAAWIWDPITYLNDPNAGAPVSQPLESMKYTVSGYNIFGCTDTAQVKIGLDYNSRLKIPSAFSPNGDGLNDEFKIHLNEYEKLLTFQIFNRWGEMVFQTNNINKGWDGSYKNRPAPTDTYMYYVEVLLPGKNGGKVISLRGDITLVR